MKLILILDAPNHPQLTGRPGILTYDGQITAPTLTDQILAINSHGVEYIPLLNELAAESAWHYARLLQIDDENISDKDADTIETTMREHADIILDNFMDGEPAARQREHVRAMTQVQAIRDYKKALG